MKKFLTFTLAACILISSAFGLAACGGNTPSDEGGYTFETAYARAAELGYSGTLEEFIESISGKDGKDGAGIQSVTLVNGEIIILGTDGNILLKEKLPLCKHVYGDTLKGLAPTCTSAGYNYRICLLCGDKDYEVIAQTGHKWNGRVVVIEPECNKNGLGYYACTVCGETKTEKIDATGKHDFKNGVCIYCNLSKEQLVSRYYNNDYGYEYFSSLSDGEKFCNLYDEINKQVVDFHFSADADAQPSGGNYELPAINYADLGLTRDQAVSVWKTYADDNPLYYWLSKTLTVSGNDIILNVEAEYAQGVTREEYNEKLYELIDGYKTVAEGESAFSVALAYHDLIINDIDYAYKYANVPEDAAWAHNITGVFEKKGAVCEGYARAFQLLLNTRGIENIFVTGESRNQNHAWNLVKLDDGKWYWYDLTWDDTSDLYWGVSHDYACVLDDEFLKNHTPAESTEYGVNFLYGLPARSAENYGGGEIKVNDSFTGSGFEYCVTGYSLVCITKITSGGDVVIPEKTTYRGREFTITGLASFKNGKPSSNSIFVNGVKAVSVCVPSTVVYIGESALSGNGTLENINVNENNPRFRSVDGVLFTKSLYTLIHYPAGSTRIRYSIPDETHYVLSGAFRFPYNSPFKLEALNIGKNLEMAGILGSNYPDAPSSAGTINVISIVSGCWNYILRNLSGAKLLTVNGENANYKVKDNMLFNLSETFIYAGLPHIETAVIPETVIDIDTDAFNYCKKLKSVKFSSGLTTLSRLFNGCTALEEVILPDTLKTIKNFSFASCSALKEIVLPESLKTIEQHAFLGCVSLDSINIPQNVTSIGVGAFEDCTGLREITVSDDNPAFAAKNNCLIDVAAKKLIKGLDSAVIPNDGSVTEIGDSAFSGCKNISEIIIPEGVVSIGDHAFANCISLNILVIPKSVTVIGNNVSMNVYNLDVYYKGTETEWHSVDKDKAFSEYNRGKTYFYSETEPTNSGNYWHYLNGEIAVW